MRVLTSDLRWKEAQHLSVGDELLAFTEALKHGTTKYEFSKVLSIQKVVEPSYKMVMSNRAELISSHNHQWVASSPSRHHLKWRFTEDLKPGYNLRWLVEPFKHDQSYWSGWLAGYLDGEGSLSGTQLAVGQKDDSVLDKSHNLLEQYTKGTIHETFRPALGNRQNMWILRLATLPDIIRILGQVRPIRLLENWPRFISGKSPTNLPRVSIKSMEFIGEQEVYSIETSTSTMIVEGFLSHNCHNRWHAANNKEYDWNNTAQIPHRPRPMTEEEKMQATWDEFIFKSKKEKRIRD